MQPLLNEDHIGKAERDHLFMEGIPSKVQVPIQMHLMIKHPDHYPQDPYLYTQVYDAGQFILPANMPLPISTPNAQDAILMLSPLAPSMCEQMPTPGTVIKHKYRCEASSFHDCAFCSSIEHFFTCCLERQRYIDAGKCKVHEEMCKLVLPNGDFIPGHGLIKYKLNQYYANHTMQEVKASEGITAGLFYRANSEIDTIVEVGSSMFVHTIAHPDVEESLHSTTRNTARRERQCALMALRYCPICACTHSLLRKRQWSRTRLSRQKCKPQVQKAKDWKSWKLRCIMYLSLTILQRELPWCQKVLCLHPHNQPCCPLIILCHHYPHPHYLHLPRNQQPIAMHSH